MNQEYYENRESYELNMILIGQGLDIEDCKACHMRKCMCQREEED